MRDDLTDDGLSVSARTDDGLLFALALVGGLALVARAGRLIAAPRASAWRSRPPAHACASAHAPLAALVIGLPSLVLGALALSDRGIGHGPHQARRVHRAQVRPPERPRPRAEDQLGQPLGLVGGGGGRLFATVRWSATAPARFPLVHRLYRDNVLEVRQPHNVPLEFLSETGLIGALLALGGLALLGVAAVRTGAGAAAGTPSAAFAAALLVGAGAWGLHIAGGLGLGHPRASPCRVLIFLGVLAARPPGTAAAQGRARRRLGRRAASLLALGRWPRCVVVATGRAARRVADELTDDALSQAASNTPADLDARPARRRLSPSA